MAVPKRTFVVGHIDWFNHELLLQTVVANTWQEAVMLHSKYPYAKTEDEPGRTPTELQSEYPEETEENSFRQSCFDCDCMMNWIEVTPTP